MNEVDLDNVLIRLKEILPEERISRDPAITIAYTRDSSYILTGISDTNFVVVLPENTKEVQDILRLANELNMKVVVEGTGSNLVGLTIPKFNEYILMDLKRMRSLKIDKDLQIAILEPGVTHGQLSREASKYGLKYIGPLAPYSTSVIGNIAYTSMKPGATRYGQDQVIALEVVLPIGEVLYTGTWSLTYLRNHTPFYRHTPLLDLTSLFLFTRGTLGIITKAAIRLYPVQEVDEILVMEFDDLSNLNTFAKNIQHLYIPSTLLAISGSYLPKLLRIPETHEKVPEVKALKHVLIVEVEGTKKQVETNVNIITTLLKSYNGQLISDLERDEVIKMLSPSLYSPRMLQPFGAMLPSVCYAPIDVTPRYVEEARKVLKDEFGFETEYVIYYQYQGLNTYIEIDIHYDPTRTRREKILPVLKFLSSLKRKHGCVSTSNEEFARTGLYYEIALKIKRMLDPKGILNPHRLFKEI